MRRAAGLLLVVVLIGVVCAVTFAQRGGFYFREGSFAARYAPDHMPDGSFVICRLAYTRVRAEASFTA